MALVSTKCPNCGGDDAVISQKSFKVVVETKLHGQFNEKQQINHLESFEENILGGKFINFTK